MFDVSYELLNEEEAIAHVVVHKWSHTIARKLDKACGDLMAELRGYGVQRLYAVGPATKFCEYMGGEYVGSSMYNGKNVEVYKWELK